MTTIFAQEVVQTAPSGQLPMLSPEDTLETIHLPDGYSLEVVLAEPHISEPVVSVFDGNGRLYVAEMRTYMQDADATGENDPVSRVSWHEDTDGDGKMDKHGVFADNLLLPRAILPLDDRILIQETNTNDVYAYRDTDGDGTADEKTPFFTGGPREGNMEHQPSGLIWAMDNTLYTTYNNYRLRYQHEGAPTKENTGYGHGQWGLCQDNYGKPWFVNAGGENGPMNFQQPILYGSYSHGDEFPLDYREVFPLVGIPDVQGGEKRFRPEDNTLNHFTATCGQAIFRGDRLPDEVKGNLLFSEPVGRLVRRSPVEVKDGITYLSNAHPKSEFLRSTDPNFRIVNMNNAPDGTLHLVDMYRGIIQQGNWTAPRSYLRKVIEAYGFDKNIGMGRIYRLVHKDHKPDQTRPQMLSETPAQLVAHLSHPNGWWRDTAQKLLVVKNDASVVPALVELIAKGENELAKHHALWTLEGMGQLTVDTVRTALQDSLPSVRRAALRVSERLYQAGDQSLAKDYEAALQDTDPDIVIQALLTAKQLNLADHRAWAEAQAANHASAGVKSIASQIITGKKETTPKLPKNQLVQYKNGKETFNMLCSSCHGADGTGTKITGTGADTLLAPSFVNNTRLAATPDLAIKTILHGLIGPLDGVTYAGGMMAPMADHNDQWIADVLSYIRYKYNKNAGFVSADQVKVVRADNADRKAPWTLEELIASCPQTITDRSAWQVTASHNTEQAGLAIDGKSNTRHTTNAPMKNGMFYQIELPEPTQIVGLELDYTRSPRDHPHSFVVEHSLDGQSWHVIHKGKGERNKTSITFPQAAELKFLKITSQGGGRNFWSIHELNLVAAPEKP